MSEIQTPSGKFVPCPRHPTQPAGRCAQCYREAAPWPPAEIEEAKAKLRRAGRHRAEADAAKRRAAAIAPEGFSGEGTLTVSGEADETL